MNHVSMACTNEPLTAAQWISEVLHFCQGLPIILVGCKKDLRFDQKTIEELHKTSQKPVTPEQVSTHRIRARTASANTLPLGRGCSQEDWRPEVPRVLRKDERGCPGGIRARYTSSPAHPEREEVKEVLDLVGYAGCTQTLGPPQPRDVDTGQEQHCGGSRESYGGVSFREG
jgi:hypothetical protein